jgi:predicted small lipoprotein YifL
MGFVLLGLAALTLSGCGRIGPLEPPGGVPKQAATPSTSPTDQPMGLNSHRTIPPIVAPQRDLPIDFLLK